MTSLNVQRVARILTTTLFGFLIIGLALAPAAPALGQAHGTFAHTGSMNTARGQHGATLLQSGEVLVSGGVNSAGILTSAELYHPSSRKWTFTGSMHTSRVSHTSTLLQNGQVLVSGGASGNDDSTAQTSAELFDLSTGAWSVTGTMHDSRASHTATLLNNGKVLVAGGESAVPGGITTLSSAELYDSSTGTWTRTGSMSTSRVFHTATLLGDGEVLVAGGNENGDGFTLGPALSSTTQLPASGPLPAVCTRPAVITRPRCCQTARCWLSAAVAVIMTAVASLPAPNCTTPLLARWTRTGGTFRNSASAATLLGTGKVLLAGGAEVNFSLESPAALYDPSTGTWTATGNLSPGSRFHTATLLQNGQALVAGGFHFVLTCRGGVCTVRNTILTSAELYTP
jgi:hypothetical protein